MDSPDPPPAPDYTGAAEQEAAGNLAMARYQTNANRVNQINPWGSITYTNEQSFDQEGYNNALKAWQDENNARAGQGYWQTVGGGESSDGYQQWVSTGGDASTAPRAADYMRDNWTQTQTLTPEL